MEAKRKRTKNIIIAAVLVAVAIWMAALPAMLSSGQKEEDKGTEKSVAVQRGDIDSTVADAVVFGILIIVLLFKPSGIMGKNVREKV